MPVKPRLHRCPVCGATILNTRRVYCNKTHRMRAYRMRRAMKVLQSFKH